MKMPDLNARLRQLALLAGAVAIGVSLIAPFALHRVKHAVNAMYHRLVGGGLTDSASTAAANETGAVPVTKLGLNLSDLNWWHRGRAYGNLAMGGTWQMVIPGRPWAELNRYYQTPDGGLKSLPAGAQAVKSITQPMTGPEGMIIQCSFQGDGWFKVSGARDVHSSRGHVSFRVVNTPATNQPVNVYVDYVNPKRPITQLDCREAGYDRDIRFDPDFIKFVSQFRLIRFMDLQVTNANRPISWATRKLPSYGSVVDADGMSVEDMVELANLTHTDAWFNMPWNASPDYVSGFANYVHAHLNPGQVAYVEVANEVWNGIFPIATQSRIEGRALGLSDNDYQAQLKRYSQRTREIMTTWTRVFYDNPQRLVRVIASQNANPSTAETVLSFGDTAKFVDALATAPYFSNGGCPDAANAAIVFECLAANLNATLDNAMKNKQVAHKYGKRYITYEAGQHAVIPNNVELLIAVSRDPRMEALYTAYIKRWQTEIGDYLVLFSSISPVTIHGAWGLQEYPNQPLSETPKMRALVASGLTK